MLQCLGKTLHTASILVTHHHPGSWADAMLENTLYYGDNLDILREHIPDGSVDLIYLDPPFNSSRSYNALFKEATCTSAASQIGAVSNTYHERTS